MSQIKNPDDRKTMVMPEIIARLCHSANRAYCDIIGDPVAPAWDDLDEDTRQGSMAAVRLAGAAPDSGRTNEALHEAWVTERKLAGWKYGKELDRERKIHPNLVPFDELPVFQRRKDNLFRHIVKAMIESPY